MREQTLEELQERIRTRMMVAGQCGVEGPEGATETLMAAAEAEFLREVGDSLSTLRTEQTRLAQRLYEVEAERDKANAAVIRSLDRRADLDAELTSLRADQDMASRSAK